MNGAGLCKQQDIAKIIVYLKNLNIRAETIKHFNENKGQKLQDTGFDNDFLDTCQRHRQRRKNFKKTTKTYFITIKNFCVSKDTIMKAKRKPTEQEKIFTNHVNIQNILKIHNKR